MSSPLFAHFNASDALGTPMPFVGTRQFLRNIDPGHGHGSHCPPSEREADKARAQKDAALASIQRDTAISGYAAYRFDMRQCMKDTLHADATAPGEGTDGGGAGRKPLYWPDPMVLVQKFDDPGKFPVMDTQLVHVYGGDEARAQALPGSISHGKVGAIFPEVNAATRSLKARIELANPNRHLVPGMFRKLMPGGREGTKVRRRLRPQERRSRYRRRRAHQRRRTNENHHLPTTHAAGRRLDESLPEYCLRPQRH